MPLDDHGRPRKDIVVSYSRRGGVHSKSQTFQTECGALLGEWREYNAMRELHAAVARQSAAPMPYVEHMPVNEQSRMNDEARAVEELLHNDGATLDVHGYAVPKEKVLRKVERPVDSSVQSFAGNLLRTPRVIVPSFPAGTLIVGVKSRTGS